MIRTPRSQPVVRLTAFIGVVVLLAGCSYQAVVSRLTPDEQAEFRAYSKVMTSSQVRAYGTNATPAERAAYLNQIGVAQRFQGLEPQDREAVLAGYVTKGMSAEAVRFAWGDPYYDSGYRGHYEHWYYLGSSDSLAERGNDFGSAGSMVDVYLVNGQVEWVLDFVPTRGLQE